MRLNNALRYSGPAPLAFVGAGGKTSALFQLAGELVGKGERDASYPSIFVTTTTHLGTWQARRAEQMWWIKSINDLSCLEDDLPAGIILLAGGQSHDRLVGLAPELLEPVRKYAENHRIPMIIEADGAQSRPLKAPGLHEPAIPDFVMTVVVVAGLSGLGKRLSEKWVHRPEFFARLSGLPIGGTITPEAVTRILSHEAGGLKNIPFKARKVLLLNQADSVELHVTAEEIAQQLTPLYDGAIIAALSPESRAGKAGRDSQTGTQPVIHEVIEPVAGIVLAAGGSHRFGSPKQLLAWQGQPLVRHVALAALQAGLAPVKVVVGASAAEVSAAVSDLPVRIANNPAWSEGLSSSIKQGINALSTVVGGAIFLHADQPQVSPQLIRKLVQAHRRSLSPIIAPRIHGQRGTPVLFDVRVFPAFQTLQGDRGGRDLFENYPPEWIEWNNEDIIVDIDTPEDYHNFLKLYPEQTGNP